MSGEEAETRIDAPLTISTDLATQFNGLAGAYLVANADNLVSSKQRAEYRGALVELRRQVAKAALQIKKTGATEDTNDELRALGTLLNNLDVEIKNITLDLTQRRENKERSLTEEQVRDIITTLKMFDVLRRPLLDKLTELTERTQDNRERQILDFIYQTIRQQEEPFRAVVSTLFDDNSLTIQAIMDPGGQLSQGDLRTATSLVNVEIARRNDCLDRIYKSILELKRYWLGRLPTLSSRVQADLATYSNLISTIESRARQLMNL